MDNSCVNFILKAFKYFRPCLDNPRHKIYVKLKSNLCSNYDNYSVLGKDAKFKDNHVALNSGHEYIRKDNISKIFIPKYVKRGRIPFKRLAPGRHIVDEILEPYLIHILKEYDIDTFHASAILAENDQVIIHSAWRNTGKTEKIIPLIGTGRILSDDLTMVNQKKNIVFSYPRPIRLYKYNLNLLPLSKSFITFLKIKSFIYPPWKPLYYFPINPNIHKSHSFINIFLNKISEDLNVKTFINDAIIEFETDHFSQHRSILRIAGILK